MSQVTCCICGRVLTNPESVAAGIGPVCSGRSEATMCQSPLLFNNDIICRRSANGLETNVPHAWKLHSPTGFDIGYGGSGPADFALNILLLYVDRKTAHRLHQDFKWKFIANMPKEGGTIEHNAILQWLKDRGAEFDKPVEGLPQRMWVE